MIDDWKLTQTKKLLHTKPFSIWQKTYQKPHEEGIFEASVIETPDWANIIAITPEQMVPMEEEPLDSRTSETIRMV